MPASNSLMLAGAVLLLVMAIMLLSGHRRREREQLDALREREEKLRLALWASSEL